MKGRGRAIPYIAQAEMADCGAAALAMALGYHGRHVSLAEAHEATGTGRDGIDALRLAEAATSFGLRARGVATELDDLRALPRGTVLHWGASHFIVLDSTSRRGVTIVDPAAGRYRLSWDAVNDLYSGVAVMLEPGDGFAAGGRRAPGALHHARRLLARSTGIGRVLATSVVVRVMALAVPVLTGVVVDRVVPNDDGRLLKVLAAVMAALVIYSVLATYLRAHLLLRLRSRLDVDMTLDFLEHLVDLPYAFFLKRSSGDLMMRLRSNATVREILTTGTISALLDGALATLYLVVIVALSPALGLLVCVLGAAQVAVLLAARRRNQHLMGESLATEARSQSYAYEMFSAVETLKAAGAERRAVAHWTNLFVAELNVSLRRGRLEALVSTAIHGLALLSPIAVLLAGAELTSSGKLSLGTMLALAALATGFLEPLGILVATALQVQLLGSYLARLDDVFNTPTETAGRELRHAPELIGSVRAERLTFRYTPHGPPVVDGASLEVRPGQVLAIVGRSGSGKSTLGRLLLGLYSPSEGRVLLDGNDLATLHPRSVRSQIGVVTQDPYIFGLPIRDNLVLGNPSLPLERLESAAELAGVAEDIRAMPMGFDTPLVDAGASLSGGQRQRLALARALAPRPRILLLDEATSSLDTVTEARVHGNIARLGCTVIVIAHRLATVIDADHIVVMDAGRVVEAGCHQELMAMGGHYARLVAGQLVGETAR
ncbi:peptidase domain-containing ABC transporter [Mycobacterium paraseoulense]|uniref:Lantibiotic ABC transporter permease n=1 Tax=Mycobacterium paraseoulense TaxID=590652 RepID=A0A1X0IBW7_9MYCO|nr:peptidase domain-containing ABC transporter [Mycobacterium paraseoulense]MCV7394496.1 peptidase domain-containing ABC transporter [Mycobacterium paraseoulense]ORB42289.1 lantibiotic ABC transporter permease [Mycobacterium paraseoulense]BBZ73423.1 NHLP family bacteriocin export ABC transporter peptidase/permease/ATPase [Mycobacterium paraseoulense]